MEPTVRHDEVVYRKGNGSGTPAKLMHERKQLFCLGCLNTDGGKRLARLSNVEFVADELNQDRPRCWLGNERPDAYRDRTPPRGMPDFPDHSSPLAHSGTYPESDSPNGS